MNKKYLFGAMAIVALASCSQDESLKVNRGLAIDFRTAMETRANELKTENLHSFSVVAYTEGVYTANRFAETFVNNSNTTNDGSNTYYTSSGETHYWPMEDADQVLRFYAYAPTDIKTPTITCDETTNTLTLTDYEPAADIANHKDFISAYNTGNKTNNLSTGVALKFKHHLAQIVIKAKNNSSRFSYEVTGVRIGNVKTKSTFTGTYTKATSANQSGEVTISGTWGTHATAYTDYESEYTTPITLNGTAVSIMPNGDDNAMIIPQSIKVWSPDHTNPGTEAKKGAYIGVKVKIVDNVISGSPRQYYPGTTGQYGWVAIPVPNTATEGEWKQGMKYTYILDFTDGAGYVEPGTDDDSNDQFEPEEPIFQTPIRFTVTVEEWDEDLNGNTTKDDDISVKM